MRVESFEALGVTIFNSLSDNGVNRWFCTWCDEIGTVAGQSLQYPWRRLSGAGVEVSVGPSSSVLVARGGRSLVEVTLQGGDSAHLTLRASGIRNDVLLERERGIILARFPSLSSNIEIDLESLWQSEKTLLLAVLGAGLIRRARRFGLLSRSWLPSSID